MALAVPGTSSSTLVLTSANAVAQTGADKLDPRFSAMLSQAKISKALMDILGDADVESAAIFGHLARSEENFLELLKSVLNLDADTRPLDAIPIAKLTLVWEACRKRTEVEQEASARRPIDHLPPQLTLEDHQTAREAFEKGQGQIFPGP